MNPSRKAWRFAAAAGFTLLELMVSTAIIGIIMMVLLATTSTSLGLWRTAEQRISVEREGRNALAIISGDLENMVWPSSDKVPEPVIPVDSGTIESGRDFLEFLVTRPPDYQDQTGAQVNAGDICYVKYRFIDNQIQRAAADSGATFAALQEGRYPAVGNYDVVAANIPDGQLWVYARDAQGKTATAVDKVALVSVSFGAVDAREMESIRAGINFPSGKTSKQYFSSRVFLPSP
jgi:prepilin-type N-terminal cleavage/methylation domain-containing protein